MKRIPYPSTPLTRPVSLPEPGRVGILYVQVQRAGGGRVSDAEFRRWTAFAESRLHRTATRLDLAGKQWMSRDLFLYVNLPPGERDRTEEWLLREALRLAREWQEQFAGSAPAGAGGTELLAGVAVFEQASSRPDAGEWYESVKRAVVHGQKAASLDRSLRQLALERILREDSLYPVYQPIFALRGGGVFGYEALTRIRDSEWFKGPQPLFAFAEEANESYRLDRLTREKAIASCAGLGKGQKLFINVMAHLMDDPRFTPGCTLRLLEECGLSPDNVVFELTERSSIEDFAACKKMLAHYRSQGYKIAIDDVGAGYSSLQSIVELHPDYIKIDRSLVSGIHLDEMKEQVMGTFVGFASRMGIQVVAEGIECEEELDKVRGMGVDYAQGFLLGKPSAFPVPTEAG